MGFRVEKSLGKTFPRIEKRRATFRTCPATLETFLVSPCLEFLPSVPSQKLVSF
jgi:hypothetical protein